MQIFLTEAFTFMLKRFMQIPPRIPTFQGFLGWAGLRFLALGSADDPGAAAVRIELQLHTIADEHFDSMQTHFSGEVREYQVTVFELYAK
jgi:hypothetical protein